jgi:hypothetical protein
LRTWGVGYCVGRRPARWGPTAPISPGAVFRFLKRYTAQPWQQ